MKTGDVALLFFKCISLLYKVRLILKILINLYIIVFKPIIYNVFHKSNNYKTFIKNVL